jgi:diguanylate cyclase (GGDEF)-like protein
LDSSGGTIGVSLSVLLVEDSEVDAELIVRELKKGGYNVSCTRVESADGLTAALSRGGWDVAISDFTLPGFSGVAALAQIRDVDAELPFVFASGTIGEDAAVAAMRMGADDYVMKGNLKRLVPAIERALREVVVRRARKRAEERVLHLAYHDPLTDLPNRSLLRDRLDQALIGAQRTHEPVALLVMDLDAFKEINDSLGHHAGDAVLRLVASRLNGLLREVDTVARLGGDEFAFVLPRTDSVGAMIAARKILHALKQPFLLDTGSLPVNASIGIASFPEHGATAGVLLQKADIAMYAAKNGKLEAAVYMAERDRQAHQRLTVMTELQDAIARDEFVYEYQPIVNLQNGAIVSVEALARWHHPRQGVLLPSAFIDLAEQSGLIEPLTISLLEKALRDWSETFAHYSIPIAVNLSVRSLRDPELPDRIGDLLQSRGVAPAMLHLEITENFIMSDPFRATKYLTRLHDMGTKISIDDFGTGYSSLSYLRQLPVDELKIDRSFVVGLTREDEAIVRCVIDLGHNLGLTAVAEGVESAAVRDRLALLGCDAAQGNFLARPQSASGIQAWIDDGKNLLAFREPDSENRNQYPLPKIDYRLQKQARRLSLRGKQNPEPR